MTKSIAVLGCGWLGLPLAQHFLKQGFRVKGSTTSEEKLPLLERSGIPSYLIQLFETEIKGDIRAFLTDVDILVINVPPRLRNGKGQNYVKKMRLLLQAIDASTVKNVIFVSSTSVYGAAEGEVTEKTRPKPVTESGRQLLVSEKLFGKNHKFQTTVVRFGGLIGPKRHPVTMLSKKSSLTNGHHPVNLIHLNDCVRILYKIIAEDWWDEILNAVHPEHPTKEEYYIDEAKKRGIPLPVYKGDNSRKGKIIRSETLINVKGFTFTTTL
ncbi:SDR family oxidoreductase [Pseudozobellia thermophila]|uniref:Nucleoside-diphosphate-sugar epimerase n=1 Tax=Pseudozobellia thermophila TaxID=192903 RepID=A0A1M6CIM7_9FLAO|nr:SDR family oxidoreductase [Pseudozobellia thermophila]SHI60763.1 Nucleoside-diphosphate-sugar epimerase [Pseudozobellia thermophila]